MTGKVDQKHSEHILQQLEIENDMTTTTHRRTIPFHASPPVDMLGLEVDIYWNINSKCWSIRSRETGRVVCHALMASVDGAQLVVGPKGRERVLESGRKNGHAFVRGRLAETPPLLDRTCIEFSYNPRLAPHFYDMKTNEKIESVAFAVLDTIMGAPSGNRGACFGVV